jgi:hypothetical protein
MSCAKAGVAVGVGDAVGGPPDVPERGRNWMPATTTTTTAAAAIPSLVTEFTPVNIRTGRELPRCDVASTSSRARSRTRSASSWASS